MAALRPPFRSLPGLAVAAFLGVLLLLVLPSVARSAPSFDQETLRLFYPAGIATAPCEVPIRGLSTAADWADLRVSIPSWASEVTASIDPVRGVLVFTPPVVSPPWRYYDFNLVIFDKDTPWVQARLAVEVVMSDKLVPRGVRYGSVTAAPVVLADNSLVIYPDGSLASELLICLADRPSDFVLGPDGRLAYLLFGGTRTVTTVDLVTRRIVASVRLADYNFNLSYGAGGGRIALGVADQIFTLDETQPRTLRRQSLSTGKTLQTLPAAPTTPQSLSWSDIAIGPDRTTLWAFAYGGFYSDDSFSILQRFPLNAKGAALSPAQVATNTGPTRRDLSSLLPRLLLADDGRRLAIDHRLYDIDAGGVPQLRRELPAVARILAPGGGLLAMESPLENRLLEIDTGLEFSIPGSNASTPSRRFYFFGNTYLTRPDPTFRLLDYYRAQVLANGFKPGDGRLVFPTTRLSWPGFPGAGGYLFQLRETHRDGAPLEPAPVLLDTEAVAPEATLPSALQLKSTYQWKLAPQAFASLSTAEFAALGADFTGSFTVTDVIPDQTRLDLQSLAGLAACDRPLALDTLTPGTAWTLRSDQAWLQVPTGSGVGPAEVTVRIDATALPAAGTAYTATLTLATTSTSLAIPVSLIVLAPKIERLVSHDSDARCFAYVGTNHVSSPFWAVEIDTATRRWTRGIPLPGAMDEMIHHPQDNALYFRGSRSIGSGSLSQTVVELHTVSLADFRARTIGVIPNFSPLSAAGPGRLFLPSFDWNNTTGPASLLNTQTGATTPGPVAPYGRGTPSPDGTAFYRFALRPTTEKPWRTCLEKVALTAPDFPVLASVELSAGFEYFIPAPSLLGKDRVTNHREEFDLDLQPLAAIAPRFPEPLGTDASGTLRLAATQAYDLTSSAPGRSVAAASTPKTLNPATGLFVFASADRKSLSFLSWDQLPLLTVPQLTVATVAYNRIGFSLTPAEGITDRRIQYRPAGSGTWTNSYYSTTPSTFFVYDLQASTAYEFRLCCLVDGVLSEWSEPVSATTAIAPPSWNPGLDTALPTGLANAAYTYTIPVEGSGLTVQVDGLPQGLTFDPATLTLSGTPQVSGRYILTVRAENSSGAITREVRLSLQAISSLAPTARYTGLIEFTDQAGPLVGHWNATRSGDLVTGIYRSAIFSRSFKLHLGGSAPLSVSGYTTISYQGVRMFFYGIWDKTTDTFEVHGSTDNAVEDFYFRTDEETGLASHWLAKTAPYPHAARYPALLVPGEGEGALLPEGAGLLTVVINADGLASLTGETALGQKITMSTYVSDAHSLPFFYFNKKDTLAVGGLEVVTEPPAGPRLHGGLIWAKDTNRKASAYRDGFEQELLVVGAPLPAVGKNLPPLAPLANPAGRADLLLSGGGLVRISKPIAQTLVPGPAGFTAPKAGSAGNPHRVAVKLDPKTGLVTGSAAVLNAAGTKPVRTVKFRGMLLKDLAGDGEDLVGGYFLFPDAQGVLQSGALEIAEPEPPDAP